MAEFVDNVVGLDYDAIGMHRDLVRPFPVDPVQRKWNDRCCA
jgi:hypothetical protein